MWKPKAWSLYDRQEAGSFLRQTGRNQTSNKFTHAFLSVVITNVKMICQQLSPGLVVIMVFDITVAVIQFLNLSKFTLTSDANITGHKIKSLLLLNTDCIRNYRRKKKQQGKTENYTCFSWDPTLCKLDRFIIPTEPKEVNVSERFWKSTSAFKYKTTK